MKNEKQYEALKDKGMSKSRAARIERLEREIKGLRLELERAEEELRELTRGG